jgi:uncharacterized protein (TIGR03000 family)
MRRNLYASLFVGLAALVAGGSWSATPALGQGAQPTGMPAFLIVTVPAKDAVVEIEGTKTKATGEVRRFQSPALQPGVKYHYSIKVTWIENGTPRELKKDVPVLAGQEASIDFAKDAKNPPKDKDGAPADKDKPAEKDKAPTDKPADKPVTDKPADKPAADKPVTDKPVKDTPVKDLPPAKDTPAKDLPPAKDTPVKDKPAADK